MNEDRAVGVRAHFDSEKKLIDIEEGFNNQPVKEATVEFEAKGNTRVIKMNEAGANLSFATNYIRTTKYTMFNFIFLSLAYQYMRFSNCYFLLIMILSCTPVSPVTPLTAINPVVFVLCMSMLREGIEDYGRYKQDRTQNEQKCEVIDSNTG